MKGAHQVATGGGSTPVWRKDGKELFYMTERGQVMSVDVKAGLGLETGPPKMLFTVRAFNPRLGQYGVTANGQKFLAIEPAPRPIGYGQMHVVTPWDAALRR